MLVGKTLSFIVLVIIMTVLAVISGCIPGLGPTVTGSGKLAVWDMDYRDFTRVEAGNAFDIDINRADSYLVRITIDDNLYEYLDVSKSGDTLLIRLKPNYRYANITQKAAINLPELRKLELSGASKASVTGFSTSHSVGFDLSGASHADINGIRAGDTDFELSGASRVKMDRFPVANVDVDMNGASNATINTGGRLDVDLSGASRLYHVGNPMLGSISVSGGSTISQK